MKTMTEDELRKLALATGAELVVDGKSFNAGRAKVDAQRAPEPEPAAAPPVAEPPPAPAPAPESTYTRADVEQLLAAQEARLMGVVASLIAQASAPPAEPGEPGEATAQMLATGFRPEYDKNGAITFVGVNYERLQ